MGMWVSSLAVKWSGREANKSFPSWARLKITGTVLCLFSAPKQFVNFEIYSIEKYLRPSSFFPPKIKIFCVGLFAYKIFFDSNNFY